MTDDIRKNIETLGDGDLEPSDAPLKRHRNPSKENAGRSRNHYPSYSQCRSA